MDRKLPFLSLALQLKLLLEFAARLSKEMGASNEQIDFVVAVGGLANRIVEDGSGQYGVAVPSLASLGGPGHAGTEQVASLQRKMTVEDFVASHESLAVELYEEALWGFGIEASAMAVRASQGHFKPVSIAGDVAG